MWLAAVQPRPRAARQATRDKACFSRPAADDAALPRIDQKYHIAAITTPPPPPPTPPLTRRSTPTHTLSDPSAARPPAHHVYHRYASSTAFARPPANTSQSRRSRTSRMRWVRPPRRRRPHARADQPPAHSQDAKEQGYLFVRPRRRRRLRARALTCPDSHLGQLKAKLAKLRKELVAPTSSGGGAGGAPFRLRP